MGTVGIRLQVEDADFERAARVLAEGPDALTPEEDGALTEEWVDENQDGIFDGKFLFDPFGARSDRIPIQSAK